MIKRRTNTDPKWVSLKEKIRKRDRGCRFLRVISAKDYLILKKNAGRLMDRLDSAHVFGAGSFPHMIYEERNVILLNRYSHTQLDNCKHPVYGYDINKEERDSWWRKIVGNEIYESLEALSKNGKS